MEYKPSNGVKVARPSAMARRLGFEARYSFSLYFFQEVKMLYDKETKEISFDICIEKAENRLCKDIAKYLKFKNLEVKADSMIKEV